MPDSFGARARPRSTVGAAEAEALIHGICFKTGPPRLLGVEVEWLVHDLSAPRLPVPPERLQAVYTALRAVPTRSALTVEPGGQLELSSLPAASLMECVQAVSADLDAVRAALREDGLTLVGLGHEPWHAPRRFLRQPRYDAMEACLDRTGPAGRHMMCSSASVQVSVDAGYEEPGPLGHVRRWWLAHHLGAVLLAAFANSPLAEGRPTGRRSTRQLRWAQIGAGRAGGPTLDSDPRGAWTRHVLDAPVMCVRRDSGPWDVPEGLTLREWTRELVPRPPTREDLDYHLTTLFPPVRPRGHLELRMIDAQPGDDGWIVPLAVTAALFDDPEATETAYRAVKPLADRTLGLPAPHNPLYEDAARDALTDPGLREAAHACFTAALGALPRLGATTEVTDAVAAYQDRYVARGRCPADDLLDRLRAGADGASGARSPRRSPTAPCSRRAAPTSCSLRSRIPARSRPQALPSLAARNDIERSALTWGHNSGHTLPGQEALSRAPPRTERDTGRRAARFHGGVRRRDRHPGSPARESAGDLLTGTTPPLPTVGAPAAPLRPIALARPGHAVVPARAGTELVHPAWTDRSVCC